MYVHYLNSLTLNKFEIYFNIPRYQLLKNKKFIVRISKKYSIFFEGARKMHVSLFHRFIFPPK